MSVGHLIVYLDLFVAPDRETEAERRERARGFMRARGISWHHDVPLPDGQWAFFACTIPDKAMPLPAWIDIIRGGPLAFVGVGGLTVAQASSLERWERPDQFEHQRYAFVDQQTAEYHLEAARRRIAELFTLPCAGTGLDKLTNEHRLALAVAAGAQWRRNTMDRIGRTLIEVDLVGVSLCEDGQYRVTVLDRVSNDVHIVIVAGHPAPPEPESDPALERPVDMIEPVEDEPEADPA